MTVNISGYVNSQSAPQSQIASSGSGTGTEADIESGASNIASSYQSFLTLLTTQLQNQDPSSPMDPNSFTTELVQMTGVQQQLLTNQLLQQMTNNVSDSVGLIGKTVTATSPISNLTNGQTTWDYSLPQTAASAEVTVTNSAGTVVFSGPAPSLAAGSNAFTWDGKDNSGVQQPDGVYKLAITASGSDGSQITPTISVSGVAGSVQSTSGTTFITIGNTAVPVSSITNVAETSDSGSSGSGNSNNSSGS